MKICVLVKDVPAAGSWTVDDRTMRLDRTGSSEMNPFDAHAVEAAVWLREAGDLTVEEIVAVSMGPVDAVQALRKALALGADRAVHVSDEALAGSDLLATGVALAECLRTEQPDLVLLGQQSADGECYSMGAVIGELLAMPSVTQVIELQVDGEQLVCRRQAEYGYDTIAVTPPAVVAVGDALNTPRYASLKAIMAATRKPVARMTAQDLELDPARIGERGSRSLVGALAPSPERPRGVMVAEEDPDAAVEQIVGWLEQRGLI